MWLAAPRRREVLRRVRHADRRRRRQRRLGRRRGDAAAPNAPIAERRLVSILFADLVGFTTLAEGRDAEETRELLSRYFELAGEVIGRYGGTIEKFIGDAVMAVWGTPIARENDAERAVRAALDVVAAVKTLGPGISARAGVLTGEAAVTLGATNQGMVAGDLVNTASRLQSVAQPGTVLVGESTERAANQAIAFEPAGEQVLKGKEAPVPAFRAIRVVAERGGRGRGDQLEAPFLGRDGEFGLLKDLFHATGRERRTRIVSIVGVAGSGKSRLVWELSKYLDGVVESVLWHTGRSPAYGEGITFWALGEMVRTRAGLAETDDEPTTRAKVAETVERWVPDDRSGAGSSRRSSSCWASTRRPRWRARSCSRRGGRSSSGSPPRAPSPSSSRTCTGPIPARSTSSTTSSSGAAASRSSSSPSRGRSCSSIDRTGVRAGGTSWRSASSRCRSPRSSSCSPSSFRVSRCAAPGDRRARRRDPALRGRDDPDARGRGPAGAGRRRLRPVGRPDEPGGPGDAARPDRGSARRAASAGTSLIQDAAVLGQSFTVDGLAAVSGQDRAQVEDLCRALTRRELLVQNVDPRSAERGQVAFVQALIREVAYGTLSRRDRRSRHLAAARFFESLGEDELAGALASHYLAAYRAAPDDPDSRPLAAQAKIALRAAASRASSLGSHDQAVRFLVEAIEVTDDPAEIAELLERAERPRSTAAVGPGRTAAARCDRASRGAGRSLRARRARRRCSGRDLSTTGARRMRLPSSSRRSERTATSSTIPRSRRSSTSSRAGTGSATTRSGRSTSPTAPSGARSASRRRADCRLPHHEGRIARFSTRPYEGTGILEAGIRLAEALGLRRRWSAVC